MASVSSLFFTLTPQEVVLVEMAQKGRALRLMAIMILFGTLIFSMAQPKESLLSKSWIAGLLIVGVGGAVYAANIRRQALKPGNVKPIERKLQLDASGITIKSHHGRAELSAKHLKRIPCATDDLLFMHGKKALLVPKRAFETNEDWTKAREIVDAWRA